MKNGFLRSCTASLRTCKEKRIRKKSVRPEKMSRNNREIRMIAGAAGAPTRGLVSVDERPAAAVQVIQCRAPEGTSMVEVLICGAGTGAEIAKLLLPHIRAMGDVRATEDVHREVEQEEHQIR